MNVCWAGVYSAYKVIGQTLPTGGIVTLRFGLAALCLLFAWPWLPGSSPRGTDLLKTLLMGLMLFVLGQRLQVYGNQIGSAGNSSILMAMEPLVTSLMAALFLGEHIGPRRWAGFTLGILGVGLLSRFWRTDFQWMSLGASLIFVSSFVCESVYSVMGKPIIARASVMKMLTLSLLAGTLANLAIDGRTTLAQARLLSPIGWGLLLALAIICTAVGYTLWFVVIRECPISVAALTIFSQSVFGVLFAALWIHEKLRWGQLLGSVVIVAGLVLGLSRQVKTAQAAESVDP